MEKSEIKHHNLNKIIGILHLGRVSLYHVFMTLSIFAIIYGLYGFFFQGEEITHFRQLNINTAGPKLTKTHSFLLGQFKTIGKGFYVGKKISVTIFVHIGDTKDYRKFKDLIENTTPLIQIENSEPIDYAKRDISEALRNHNLKQLFVTDGAIKVISFDDKKQSFLAEGDVIFTKEGRLTFGFPLALLFKQKNQRLGIKIAPSSTRDQIESNRLILLLAFITVAIALLSLSSVLKNRVNN